jgi:acetyl esterase/lipase
MPLTLPRRALLSGMALTGAAAALPARAAAPAPLPITTLPVWPGSPPGGLPAGVTEQEIPRSPTGPKDDTAFLHVTRPTLMHCRPARPNGKAVLLVPGGGYVRVAIGLGGAGLLRAFADLGYNAFLLKYRLPGDGWSAGPAAPLQDAQRALRLVRSMAAAEAFDPARIALWGGSAGGHLAAWLANTAAAAYPRTDAVDDQPLGVKAALLLYPVNHMTGPTTHGQSHDELLRHAPPGADPAAYAAEASLSRATPPTFVAHALDDRVVPVENSLTYFTALRRLAVPAELHVQESGGHGFGWTTVDGRPAAWTGLAAAFLDRHV